jgi:endonuclease YncB( thermonuclease family)
MAPPPGGWIMADGRLLTVLVAAAAAAGAGAAHAGDACPGVAVSGVVMRVYDGDTIEVLGVPIRLQGIAAPELHGPGGSAIAGAVWDLVAGRTVRCELTGEWSADGCIGRCSVGRRVGFLDRSVDLAAVLVREGLARDCPGTSGGRYRDEERRAVAGGARIRRIYPLPDYCGTR